MTRETLSYESGHDVGSYVVNGVNLWPYLRTNTAWRKLNERGSPSSHRGLRHAIGRCRRYSRLLFGDRKNAATPRRGQADVVFVTQSNRRERVAGVYWHPLADPMAAEFERRGVGALVIEAGQARMPRARPSMMISREFKLRRVLGRLGPSIREPEWFAEYSRWAGDFLGRPVNWPFWEFGLRQLFAQADYLTRLFDRLDTKAVFVDCWYSPESLAATLAARKLGLMTFELQHGLQGQHMNGYTGWRRPYDLIPSTFWVWGNDAAAALNNGNAFGDRALVGGNCWLNAWRGSTRFADSHAEIERAKALRAGASCLVLFTVQHGIDLEPVFEAIERSPRSWRWLIRVHRKIPRNNFTASLERRLHGPRSTILVDEASDMPLYALLSAVDVHVTSFSTCALEALAFGKPTVTFGDNARAAFGSLLESGAMTHASDGQAIVDEIASFTGFGKETALQAADSYYAGTASTRRAFDVVETALAGNAR